MSIFAISDIHLSLSEDKPMDVFGSGWEGYVEKIKYNWERMVKNDDTVLVPGDISWAMYINEALADFKFLDSLPGKKIILKGNHDYWWDTVSKIKRFFLENDIKTIEILHNNSFIVENTAVIGTRGWILKNAADFLEHDTKIYNRETERLKLSFLSLKNANVKKVVMMHYPPINKLNTDNEFTRIMEANEVDLCIFGHIHSRNSFALYDRIINGVQHRLVSCDSLDFVPLKISDFLDK